MFPTTGQGACQCLEDAAALGVFLDNTNADLSARLQLFQNFRRERVVPVHAISGVLLGQESGMDEKRARLLPGGKPLSGPLESLELTNASVFLSQIRIFFEAQNTNNMADTMSSLRVEDTLRNSRPEGIRCFVTDLLSKESLLETQKLTLAPTSMSEFIVSLAARLAKTFIAPNLS
jgi:hypothetical protein